MSDHWITSIGQFRPKLSKYTITSGLIVIATQWVTGLIWVIKIDHMITFFEFILYLISCKNTSVFIDSEVFYPAEDIKVCYCSVNKLDPSKEPGIESYFSSSNWPREMNLIKQPASKDLTEPQFLHPNKSNKFSWSHLQ